MLYSRGVDEAFMMLSRLKNAVGLPDLGIHFLATNRPCVEIEDVPTLDPSEKQSLDFHAALNALNVVAGELYLLSEGHPLISEKLNDFAENVLRLAHRTKVYCDPEALIRDIIKTTHEIDETLDWVESFQRAHPDKEYHRIESLKTILTILRARMGEIDERRLRADEWIPIPKKTILEDLQDFFAAVSRHSKGRYNIVFDSSQKRPQDYFIDLKIKRVGANEMLFPVGFMEIVRDLTANARKYSEIGSSIHLTIIQDVDALTLSVEDNGLGIPSEEITHVCNYGMRGSNITNQRTLGAGLGLTKAVSFVKLWGGRFWIASERGAGTVITLRIPTPHALSVERRACAKVYNLPEPMLAMSQKLVTITDKILRPKARIQINPILSLATQPRATG